MMAQRLQLTRQQSAAQTLTVRSRPRLPLLQLASQGPLSLVAGGTG